MTRLLEQFAGEPAPSPPWFRHAVSCLPEERMLMVEGAAIECLSWGKVGNPGLLFIHGNLGHAHWWSFIAPFLMETHRVTALSLSGMGRSAHRSAYSMATFAAEALTAAQETGLFDHAIGPVVLGHSAGAGPAAMLAATNGDRLRGVVILDSGIRPPEMMPPQPLPRTGSRIYATLAAALGAYRFAPPQDTDNLFIADWIARHAIKRVADGWTWRFDPKIFSQIRASDAWHHLLAAACPLAFINGGNSVLTPPDRVAYIRARLDAKTLFVTIPDAAHHLMVDQPMAVVTAIRAILACWQHH